MILELIYRALRRLNSDQINDVTREENEIIITLDGGKQWLISHKGIKELLP